MMPDDDFPPEPESYEEIRKCLRTVEAELAYMGNLRLLSVLKPEDLRPRLRKAWANLRATLFGAMAHATTGESEDLD